MYINIAVLVKVNVDIESCMKQSMHIYMFLMAAKCCDYMYKVLDQLDFKVMINEELYEGGLCSR